MIRLEFQEPWFLDPFTPVVESLEFGGDLKFSIEIRTVTASSLCETVKFVCILFHKKSQIQFNLKNNSIIIGKSSLSTFWKNEEVDFCTEFIFLFLYFSDWSVEAICDYLFSGK